MKLSNELRDSIAKKIIVEKYSDKIKQAKKQYLETVENEAREENKNSLCFYEKSGEMKKYIRCGEYIRLKNKEGNAVYNLGKDYDDVERIIEKNIRSDCVDISFKIPFEQSHDCYITLTKEIQYAADRCNDIFSKAQKDYEDIHALLYSCTTVKQLSETLPEIERYIPVQAQCTTIIPIETVNRCKSILGGK